MNKDVYGREVEIEVSQSQFQSLHIVPGHLRPPLHASQWLRRAFYKGAFFGSFLNGAVYRCEG